MTRNDYYDPAELSPEREQELARAVLVAVASDTGRCWHLMGRDGLAEVVTGPPPRNSHGHLDMRTNAGRAWGRAQLEAADVVCRLALDYDLLAEAPCDKAGQHPDMRTVLTDKGRAWLAAEALTS